MRPCVCERVGLGQPYDLTQCRLCYLYHHDPAYRALWGGPDSAPGRGLPCQHLGGETGEVVACETCPGSVRLKLFACAVHGRCTTAKKLDGVACCAGCPDRSEAPPSLAASSEGPAVLTQDTPVSVVVRLLEGGPSDFPTGWSGWENVRLAHVRLLERAIETCPPYPAARFGGRGIVTCVNAKPGVSSGKSLPQGYLPGAWVLVKELRRRGCTLPVTFAHLGPAEWDPRLTRLVKPLGVEVLDLNEAARHDPMRILAGWESKVFAIQHCPYEEVLFLDADNVPARDPTYLFDDPRYLRAGAVFWPDLPPFDRAEWLPEVVWRNVGLPPRNTVDFESGQLLIDKRCCWRELLAARHINEHSDWYYRFVFGDKSTFHLAWSKCGTAWAMPATRAGWMESSIVQHDFEGRVLFFHACQDKPSLSGYAHPDQLPQAGCGGYLAELRRLWSGRLWANDAPSPADRGIIERLRGSAFDYQRVGVDRRPLELLEGGRVGTGATTRECGWSILDGVLAIVGQDGQLTFLAREEADGTWRGRSVGDTACDVVLTPADVSNRPAELMPAGTRPAAVG